MSGERGARGDSTRRSILRTAGYTGVAAGVAAIAPTAGRVVSGDDRVEITYAYARTDPEDPDTLTPRTRYVPRDWYRRVTRAFSIHERLVDLGLPGVLGSAVVPGTYDSPVASITVDVLPDAEAVSRERLADIFESVEFALSKIERPDPPSMDGATAEEIEYAGPVTPSAVPGGILCGYDGGMGTLASALYDGHTSKQFFTTSNHLFDGDGHDSRGAELQLLFEEGGNSEIGRLREGYGMKDFARIAPVNGFSPASTIDTAGPSTVVGQYTRIGLADLKAREEPLRKVGARTGETSGQISGVDAQTCYSEFGCRRGQLRWGDEEAFSDGDSGSVSVHPDPERPDDNLLVGGFNNARTWWPGQNFVWGTAAYQITDIHGYYF